MRRSAQEQHLHDNLVKTVASELQKYGCSEIRADVPGFQRPGRIYWMRRRDIASVPDITFVKGDGQRTLVVIEADTWASINSVATQNEWRLLRKFADENKAEFHVAVPRAHPDRGDLTDARELVSRIATEMGVVVDHIWVV